MKLERYALILISNFMRFKAELLMGCGPALSLIIEILYRILCLC